MAVDVSVVAYGREALEALHAAVRTAKAADPLAPVTVVVPSNDVGVAARRHLASGLLGPVSDRGPGVAGVAFLTVLRLAELMGGPALAAAGRRPVSTPVVAAALRRALAERAGWLAPVADQPSTEEALVRAYHELADLTPQQLHAVARRGVRAGDVVGLCRRARQILEAAWYDEADLLASATAAVATAPVAGELGTVVLHLPQRLTQGAIALLAALAERAPVFVVCGATGDPGADAAVLAGVARLAGSPPTVPEALGGEALAAAEVVSVSDADEEVRAVRRRLLAAAGEGMAFERMAVLHPVDVPYARLVHEALASAGIPANGPAVRPVAERAAGRTVLAALELLERDLRRSDVTDLLAGAPILDDHGQPVPAAAWERLSREAGVVRGRADWDLRLSTLAGALRWRADVAEAADDPGSAAVRRADARRAEELRAFVAGLATRLDPGDAMASWAAAAAWAAGVVAHLLGQADAAGGWPEPERRARQRVDAAIERLAGLDDVADPPTVEVFRRTLALELTADLGRVGRLGHGVAVGPLRTGLGLDVDLLVVVGAVEGSLPATPVEDPLLADHERVAAGGALRTSRDHGADQRRQLLAAASGSRGAVVLTVPRGDLRRSTERVTSRWVPTGGATRAVEVASFAAGVLGAPFPATAGEYRLQAVGAWAGPRGDLAAAAAHLDDAVLAAGIETAESRRSGTLTRFDGRLPPGLVPSPVDGVTSATRLQTYAECPHAYLFGKVLGVEPIEEPEALLDITPLDRGSLVHDVLDVFLTEVLASGSVPEPGSPWPPEAAARLAELADAAGAVLQSQGRTGRQVLWRRSRAVVLADLARLLEVDTVIRAEHGGRPLAAELGFGRRGDAMPAVVVALPDGSELSVVGSADRVDVRGDGGRWVVDYKTGSTRPYAAIGPDDPTAGGTRLQLPVYALAARDHAGDRSLPVRADYWFTSSRGEFKRVGYEVDDEVLARFTADVAVLVDGIAGGLFPSRPPPDDNTPFVVCPWCDPDGLGTADLRRAWARKRHDPDVRPYVELVEPAPVEPPLFDPATLGTEAVGSADAGGGGGA